MGLEEPRIPIPKEDREEFHKRWDAIDWNKTGGKDERKTS